MKIIYPVFNIQTNATTRVYRNKQNRYEVLSRQPFYFYIGKKDLANRKKLQKRGREHLLRSFFSPAHQHLEGSLQGTQLGMIDDGTHEADLMPPETATVDPPFQRNFWKLYQHRFLQPNTSTQFAAFFEI